MSVRLADGGKPVRIEESCAPGADAALLRLPNGMIIVPQSRVEAEHFYEDLFEKEIYLRHGVTLAPGDCVFDVGGNIGMFALYVHRHAPGARIYTFEPAPPLFERLQANLGMNGARVRAFNFGIAEAERTARFTFYPNSSGMSSFYADAQQERDVLRVMMDRQRERGMEELDTLLEYADELLDERFAAVEMECRLRPLSAVIAEEGVQRIDLLKVDVQKAELEVLRGLGDDDWPRIRQVVMEVHDLDGRLGEITRLLEARGFRVAVEQDEAVEGSVLYNLFAVSRTVPPREGDPLWAPAGAPAPAPADEPRGWHLLLVSAESDTALDAAAARLARHLDAHPELPPAGVAAAVRAAPALSHRRAVVVGDGEDAAALLLRGDPARSARGVADGPAGSPAFLFPGVGEQYPGMGRGLYDAEPVFRREVDRCAEALRPHLGFDLREALFARDADAAHAPTGGMDLRRLLGREPRSAAAERLGRTEVAQPAAFVVGWALARLWESWGVRPHAVAGHSLGELTAACVAGVFELDDALEMVALRARAIQALPPGAMLAVSLSPREVEPWLGDGVALAAVNAPELCVLSGTPEAVARAERGLVQAGHAVRRPAATHAFHSPLMRPVAEEVAALAARMRLSAPRIPLLSNVTGTWLAGADAADPGYWARHLVGTVRFAECAAELLAQPAQVLIEMGPGGSLCAFVRQQAAAAGVPSPAGVATLPHAADDTPEPAYALGALGRLWTAGLEPDWSAVAGPAQPLGAAAAAGLLAALQDHAEPPAPPAEGEGCDAGGGGVAEALAGMWRELLGVPAGPDDDFFLLGGHSLVAARLIRRIREQFGVEMRLRTLFQTRTLGRLAQWIEHAAAE